MLRDLRYRIKLFSSPRKEFYAFLKATTGFSPLKLKLYDLAFIHRSASSTDLMGQPMNNERLEYLGDAVLGAIVAEYLFKKYPYQPEGYLTELRSKIVRRETMNNVALRMGLNKLVQYNQNDRGLSRSHIFGNALEALIGAVYLDQGFIKTRKFILNQLIRPYIDLDMMESTDTNYKNQLLSWAQRNNHELTFETVEEKTEGTRRLFTIGIMLNGELVAQGSGYNKKEAGQVAAQKGLEVLKVNG